MFTGFEYYLLLSWCYPCLVYPIHIILKKKCLDGEIFSINDVNCYDKVKVNTIRHNPPVYIGGPTAHFPIGGGISSDYETVYTAFRSKTGVYWNYDYHKLAQFPPVSSTTYVSDTAALAKIIPIEEHQRFPVSFPMKIMRSNLDNVTLYLHKNTGLVSHDRTTLLNQIVRKTRPIGTYSIPGLALALFVGSYTLYAFDKYMFPTLYKNKTPPTNIVKKILNT